jgi:hypothetical protein
MIYALLDPRDEQVRYVGLTGRSVAVRLAQHMTQCRRMRTPTHRWIAGLYAEGGEPITQLLEETDDPLRERWWISQLRLAGGLLNVYPGACEREDERRANIKAAQVGIPKPAEHTDRMKATRRRLVEAGWSPRLGTTHSPEARQRMSEAAVRRAARDGTEAHRLAGLRGAAARWQKGG